MLLQEKKIDHGNGDPGGKAQANLWEISDINSQHICMFQKSNCAQALTRKFYFWKFLTRDMETGVNVRAAAYGV